MKDINKLKNYRLKYKRYYNNEIIKFLEVYNECIKWLNYKLRIDYINKKCLKGITVEELLGE